MGLEMINEIRKKKNLSVDELAELSGVPKSTLAKITAGITTNPNLETVKAIARALGCKLDDFDSDIQKAPEPEEPESEAVIEQRAIKLYNALVSAGFVKEGQALTPRQIDFFDGLSMVIDSFLDKQQ